MHSRTRNILSPLDAHKICPVGIALALLLSPLAITPAWAGPKASAALSAIRHAYDGEDAAAQHKSVAGSLADFSPGWFAVMPRGEQYTYAMLRRDLQHTFPIQIASRSHYAILAFAQTGDAARVKAQDSSTEVLRTPQVPAAKTITTNAIIVDDWVRRGGRWLHAETHTLSLRSTVDGKVVLAEP